MARSRQRSDEGMSLIEVISALFILSLVVGITANVVRLRTQSQESNQMFETARSAVSLGIGVAETINCSGYGVYLTTKEGETTPAADVVRGTGSTVSSQYLQTLLQRPECMPPDGWVTTSAFGGHSDLGLHVGAYTDAYAYTDEQCILTRPGDSTDDCVEQVPAGKIGLVGYTDYYSTPSGDCNAVEPDGSPAPPPAPTRRVVGAARAGGEPESVADALDLYAAEAGEGWELQETLIEGPPLPATAGWIIWDGSGPAWTTTSGAVTWGPQSSSQIDWRHNWDEVWVWRPALENITMRLLLSEYEGTPPVPEENRQMVVQGRRWEDRQGKMCWILAAPAGCVGVPRNAAGGGNKRWEWLLLEPGRGIDFNKWLDGLREIGGHRQGFIEAGVLSNESDADVAEAIRRHNNAYRSCGSYRSAGPGSSILPKWFGNRSILPLSQEVDITLAGAPTPTIEKINVYEDFCVLPPPTPLPGGSIPPTPEPKVACDGSPDGAAARAAATADFLFHWPKWPDPDPTLRDTPSGSTPDTPEYPF